MVSKIEEVGKMVTWVDESLDPLSGRRTWQGEIKSANCI